MTLKFVPPPNNRNVGRYATYDTSRGLVIHNSLGTAKGALRTRSWSSNGVSSFDSYLLENVEGEWFILYNAKKGERFPWLKEIVSWSGFKRLRAVQMTNDEYADWRLRVEQERVERVAEPTSTIPASSTTHYVSVPNNVGVSPFIYNNR